jgi:hypothetical protein
VCPENIRNYYNCPTCDKRVYTAAGIPFKGSCIDCMNNMNAAGKTVNLIGGFFKGFF